MFVIDKPEKARALKITLVGEKVNMTLKTLKLIK